MKKERGEIVKISSLFDKYKTLLKAPQDSVVTEMVQVIEEVTGMKLKKTQLRYNVATRTLSIQAPSIIKQEIKFKEKTILTFAQSRLGIKSTPHTIL